MSLAGKDSIVCIIITTTVFCTSLPIKFSDAVTQHSRSSHLISNAFFVPCFLWRCFPSLWNNKAVIINIQM